MVIPAGRRAGAVWLGCAIVTAVVFGPTGMQPRDLTGLALHHPGVGSVLFATWLLIFAPTARLLLRADAARYLRSLPAPAGAAAVVGGLALIGLQAPWIALWLIGEGVRGLAVVAVTTAALIALAAWRPPRMRAGYPAWRHARAALVGIQLRALRRRAGDAVVRGAGLALLAGGAAGLFVRNNHLVGAEAAVLGASVTAVAVIPAHVGLQLVIAGAHRETGWLASSLGISAGTRLLAVVFATALVQLATTALALVACGLVLGGAPATLGPLAATSLAVALGGALWNARIIVVHADSPQLAARTAVMPVAIAALAILCLSTLGVSGALAYLATCACALLLVPT